MSAIEGQSMGNAERASTKKKKTLNAQPPTLNTEGPDLQKNESESRSQKYSVIDFGKFLSAGLQTSHLFGTTADHYL
jgi:hypothetical protein